VLKPIIFVLGLSGVGKTDTAEGLSKIGSLLHIDIDRRGGGFAKAGFPSEWDRDIARVDFDCLTTGIRARLNDRHQGAVLSFPTTYRFTREQLGVTSTHRVGIIVLWGAMEHCYDVRRKRQQEDKGTTPGRSDYPRKNGPTFDVYKAEEYDEFRVEAFQPDGSRPPRETVLRHILTRLASQRIVLIARWNCATHQNHDDPSHK
jgi:adenylate kinase family enzyme